MGSIALGGRSMVRITFPDRETSKRALGLLLGRFSGSVFRSGEQIVPKAAVKFLAERDICFTVKGKVTYEEEMAALRGAVSRAVQRRPRRSKKLAN